MHEAIQSPCHSLPAPGSDWIIRNWTASLSIAPKSTLPQHPIPTAVIHILSVETLYQKAATTPSRFYLRMAKLSLSLSTSSSRRPCGFDGNFVPLVFHSFLICKVSIHSLSVRHQLTRWGVPPHALEDSGEPRVYNGSHLKRFLAHRRLSSTTRLGWLSESVCPEWIPGRGCLRLAL